MPIIIYLIYDCNYSLPLDILCAHILICCNVVLPLFVAGITNQPALLEHALFYNEISKLFVSH